MGYLITTKQPLELISAASKASDIAMHDKFISIVAKLYQYEIFKPMLDLSASLAKDERLNFIIKERKFYELEEGNCKTTENSIFNIIRNKFTAKKYHTITIHRISAEVIVHEISHMMEQEAELTTLQGFAEIVQSDISVSASTNVSLQAAVRQIMIKEVSNYKEHHVNSEFFARYFQLMAMTKEVSGYGGEYGYNLQDMYRFFLNTSQWIANYMYPQVLSKIYQDIALASREYLKTVDEIQHKWSEERISSLHGSQKVGQAKSMWSKTIKSIKNPF
jgi:hypothetical protein